MLPAVFAMMFEARFPWLQDPDKKTHACPDAAFPVVFEISSDQRKLAALHLHSFISQRWRGASGSNRSKQ